MTGRSDSLSVGVIGAGRIATSCHLPVLHNTDGVDIAYVADVDTDRARLLANSYGAEAVDSRAGPTALPGTDVALLAVPVGVREAYIEELGERGTPILAEKPFAPDAATHRRFTELADLIACNYLRLCFGGTRLMRRLVSSGLFGRLESVRFAEGGIVGATGRSGAHYESDATQRGGGLLLETGSHGLSQLVWILEGWDLSVTDAAITWQDDYDVDVEAYLQASSEDRDIDVDFELTRIRPIETRLECRFENATARVDPEDPAGRVDIAGTDDPELTVQRPTGSARTFTQAAALRWGDFLDLVRGESPKLSATLPVVTDLIDEMYAAGGRDR